MQSVNVQTKQAEYGYLRDELAMNRKFVFERPLIIVGAALASAGGLVAVAGPGVLACIFLAALLFSLWFTHNRLNSSARIVAYLQLVHESDGAVEWVGWEHSLRLYRIWLAGDVKRFKYTRSRAKDTREYDHTVFYAPIYYLHLAVGLAIPVLFTLSSTAYSQLITGTANPFQIVDLSATGVLVIIFLIWAILYRPTTVRYLFEQNRIIWESALLGDVDESSASEVRSS